MRSLRAEHTSAQMRVDSVRHVVLHVIIVVGVQIGVVELHSSSKVTSRKRFKRFTKQHRGFERQHLDHVCQLCASSTLRAGLTICRLAWMVRSDCGVSGFLRARCSNPSPLTQRFSSVLQIVLRSIAIPAVCFCTMVLHSSPLCLGATRNRLRHVSAFPGPLLLADTWAADESARNCRVRFTSNPNLPSANALPSSVSASLHRQKDVQSAPGLYCTC